MSENERTKRRKQFGFTTPEVQADRMNWKKITKKKKQ